MSELEAIIYLRRCTGLYLYIGHDAIYGTLGGKTYVGKSFLDVTLALKYPKRSNVVQFSGCA